jgi:condensin complex subunit 3
MPGRVSARSNRSSAAPTTRKTTPAVEIPDEGETSSLRTQICQVFKDAQRTTATQRKLAINLRKIQEACCFVAPAGKKKKADEEDFDENEFNDEVVRCVVRVLNVKKGEPVGDRIIRFLGVFLKYATDKGMFGLGVEG